MDLARAKAAGIKPMQLDYFGHNVDFWFGGAVMQGDDVSARAAAAIWPTYSSDADWIAASRLGQADEAMRKIEQSKVASRLPAKSHLVVFLFALACGDSGRFDETMSAIAH